MMALDLIRQFEGFRGSPYWDVNAYRAGYGSDTATLADGRVVPIRQGMTVSRQDAERDLMRRVLTEFGPRAAAAVGQDTWSALSEPQRAALTSITYNYGSLPASVAQAVRSGDPAAAAEAIRALGGHNDGVNRGRRNQEALLYSDATNSGSGRDPAPLAQAYREGRMTPEDAALYERGAKEGLLPKIGTDALDLYQQTARRHRAPVSLPDIAMIARAAVPARLGGI